MTHDERFHPDELGAIATLKIYFANKGMDIEVIRSRDPDIIARADFVVDEGRVYDEETGRYDHHQGGVGRRGRSGIPYASFGLVWIRLGRAVCGGNAEVADIIDGTLVCAFDANDVGGYDISNGISGTNIHVRRITDIVCGFNPTWLERGETDVFESFMDALYFMEMMIRREITVVTAQVQAKPVVREAIKNAADPRLIVLDDNLPWKRVIVREAPNALYVIYPAEATSEAGKLGRWRIEGVPVDTGTTQLRKPLPAAWADKNGDELVAVTGVPGAFFCHSARFMAVADSKDAILALAKLALESQ